ncbi:MAG TPA: hypothetical protein VFR85_07775 [Anaeromyxobacteraceae bacterium]|nr:hypothetical protein [Anaeromyxobacteraceae bacterium]
MTPGAAAVLLALAASAAERGRVVSVTATHAYIDAGTEEGLAPGAELELSRNGKRVGTCRVEEASDHHAACAGSGLRPGDTFVLPARKAAQVKELPPIPSPDEQSRRLAAVQAAPAAALVEFRPAVGAGAEARPSSEAALGYAFWSSNVTSADQQVRLDVLIRDVEVARNLRLSVDLRALEWISRTSTTFLPGPSTQLLVWQAELDWRDPARPWWAGVGRIRPWYAPGASVFDGAQVGRRLGRGEIGVFGGLVPDPWTTEPTVDRYQGGGYWSLEAPIGAARLHHEGRLGFVHTPELGSRGELSATAGLWFSRALDLSAEVQLGMGDVHAPGYLDVARVAFFGRPFDVFSYDGGFSYTGLSTPETSIVRATFPGPSRRGDLTARFDVSRFVTVAATGGVVQDLTSGLRHGWVGPEVSFPRFFTPRLALSLGWLADLGWLEGQNAYLQVTAWPGDVFRLMGRLTWYQDDRPGLPSTAGQEVGLYLSGSAQLARWLAFRLSLMARGGLDFSAFDTYGFTGLASLAGSW